MVKLRLVIELAVDQVEATEKVARSQVTPTEDQERSKLAVECNWREVVLVED